MPPGSISIRRSVGHPDNRRTEGQRSTFFEHRSRQTLRSLNTFEHVTTSAQTGDDDLNQEMVSSDTTSRIAEPAPGEDNPERLADQLGLSFRNLDVLRQALTHRSVLHDWVDEIPGTPAPLSNERLEFLGDAVLGMVVAEDLYYHFPEATEGELTQRRVALVRAEQLVTWAREIELGNYLYLGQGEKITDGTRDRMLATAFEAVIGAITVDRGLRAAKTFLRRFLRRDRDRILAEIEHANPKGRLQELAQQRYRESPIYRMIQIDGPAHARVFTAEVTLAGHVLATGIGVSKRDAEQEAARAGLANLPPVPDSAEPNNDHDAASIG